MPMHSIELGKQHLNRPIYIDEAGEAFGIDFDFEYEREETAALFTKLACDIERFGENSTYPVGAIYFGIDADGRKFFLPCVNTIPGKVKAVLLEGEEKIAGSHMTSHAEFVGMAVLPPFRQVSVAVSKTICPTCLEGLCELSMQNEEGVLDDVYCDSASLQSLSAQKKWSFAKQMVVPIAQKAQIGLHLIDALGSRRIEKTLADFVPASARSVEQASPVEIRVLEDVSAYDQIDTSQVMKYTKAFAKKAGNSNVPKNEEAVTLITQDGQGCFVAITAAASLPPGFGSHDTAKCIEHDQKTDKPSYRYTMDSLKRAKIAAIANGYSTDGAMIVCTRLPTSGMLVNGVQYGIERMVTAKNMLLDLFNEKENDKVAVFWEFKKSGVIKHEEAKSPPKEVQRDSARRGDQSGATPEPF